MDGSTPVGPVVSLRSESATRGGTGRLYAFLRRFERPGPRHLVLAAALLLAAPSLVSGFSLDDYVLVEQMARPGAPELAGRMPFDLFRWLDPVHDRLLIDGQGMPWWTFAQARCAFMRPLSSLTHALDHWLWPGDPFLMHLQSLAWLALLLALAAKAYLSLLPEAWVAGVASVMFSIDSGHGAAAGWISNRNALIAGAFAIAALLFHHDWRRSARGSRALAACACFALALISGELALGVVGYLLAYALCVERGPVRTRVASLLPYGAIAGIWAGARAAAGYGSFGLGVYVDPLAEPLSFLRNLPLRWTVLISSEVSRVPSDIYNVVPTQSQPLLLAFALWVCASLFWFVWPSVRSTAHVSGRVARPFRPVGEAPGGPAAGDGEDQSRPVMRFFALGAALATLPLCATLTSDRLLVLAGFGVMPLLARGMHDALRGVGAADLRLRRLFTGLLAVAHLLVDPVLLPALALSPAWVASFAKAADASLPATPALREQTVIVAGVPDSAILSYLPAMRTVEGEPRPDKLYWLSATARPTQIERRGTRVLRVTSEDGFFDPRWESRSPGHPFHRGDRIVLSEMTVVVEALTADGRPAVCDFHFARPLDSPRYLWRTWRRGRLAPFAPPAPGQAVTLSAG